MRGFSLVEIIIAGGLTLILGTFLVSILVNTSGTFTQENKVASGGIGLNQAVDKIDSYVRQAAYISAGYPEGSPTYRTNNQVLIVKLPVTGAFGVLENTYDYVLISLDSDNRNVLRLQLFPDQASARKAENLVLTTQITKIHFTYLDENGIQVSPVSAARVGIDLSDSDRTSSTIVSLRNQ